MDKPDGLIIGSFGTINVILSLYRSPKKGTLTDIQQALHEIMAKLPAAAFWITLGDFNIDLNAQQNPLAGWMQQRELQQLLNSSTTNH